MLDDFQSWKFNTWTVLCCEVAWAFREEVAFLAPLLEEVEDLETTSVVAIWRLL